MSLYVRVHGSFWTHRKTARLRSLIGDNAFWLPIKIWGYAAANQPDGDFSDYSAEELAMLVGYQSDAQAMLGALQQAGFFDDKKIHDWGEHNAYHADFAQRAKHAAQVRWDREKEKNQKKEIRQERIGKESSIASGMLDALLQAFPSDFPAEWEHFIEHRAKKKAQMTPHSQELILRELQKRPDQAVSGVEMAITRNWTGFTWEWYDNQKQGGNGAPARKLPAYEIEKRVKAIVAARNQIYDRWRGKEKEMSIEDRRQMNELQKKRDELEGQLTQ